MQRIEAYNILRKMYDEATEEQRAAFSIAMNDIEFVDLMPEHYAPVVRCKDCKHCDFHEFQSAVCWRRNNMVFKDGFCSYGERKDGEG
jgi:hypothetical protein